jgi:predicted nucleotidyltransferase
MEHLDTLVQEGRLPARVVPVLKQFVGEVQTRLPGVVRSVALYGSVSIGAFDEKKSDVDFVVILERELTEAELVVVGEIHQELVSRDPFAKRLDGFYIPLADLQEGRSETYPYFRESVYQGLSTFGSVYRWQAGNHAVVVFGEPLEMKLPEWSDTLDKFTNRPSPNVVMVCFAFSIARNMWAF